MELGWGVSQGEGMEGSERLHRYNADVLYSQKPGIACMYNELFFIISVIFDEDKLQSVRRTAFHGGTQYK